MDFLKHELEQNYTLPAKKAIDAYLDDCTKWMAEFSALAKSPSTFGEAFKLCVEKCTFPSASIVPRRLPQLDVVLPTSDRTPLGQLSLNHQSTASSPTKPARSQRSATKSSATRKPAENRTTRATRSRTYKRKSADEPNSPQRSSKRQKTSNENYVEVATESEQQTQPTVTVENSETQPAVTVENNQVEVENEQIMEQKTVPVAQAQEESMDIVDSDNKCEVQIMVEQTDNRMEELADDDKEEEETLVETSEIVEPVAPVEPEITNPVAPSPPKKLSPSKLLPPSRTNSKTEIVEAQPELKDDTEEEEEDNNSEDESSVEMLDLSSTAPLNVEKPTSDTTTVSQTTTTTKAATAATTATKPTNTKETTQTSVKQTPASARDKSQRAASTKSHTANAEPKRLVDKTKEQAERLARLQQKLDEANKRKDELRKTRKQEEESRKKRIQANTSAKASTSTATQTSVVPPIKSAVTNATYTQKDRVQYAAMLKEKLNKAKLEREAKDAKDVKEAKKDTKSSKESKDEKEAEVVEEKQVANTAAESHTTSSPKKKLASLFSKIGTPSKKREKEAAENATSTQTVPQETQASTHQTSTSSTSTTQNNTKPEKSLWSIFNPFSLLPAVFGHSGKKKVTATPKNIEEPKPRRNSDPTHSPSISRSPLLKGIDRRVSDSSAAPSCHNSPAVSTFALPTVAQNQHDEESDEMDVDSAPLEPRALFSTSSASSSSSNSTQQMPPPTTNGLMGPPESPSIKSPRYAAMTGSQYTTAAGPSCPPSPRTPSKPVIAVDEEFLASPEAQYPVVDFVDDDTPEKHGKVPRWTNKALLFKALEAQEHIDPDTIFGTDWPRTCDLAEIFQVPPEKQHRRFRPRTSSAHWSPDTTLPEEMKRYKIAMGWHSSPSFRNK